MEQQGGAMNNHSGNASGATPQQSQQQSVPMTPEENGSEEKAGKGEGMDAWDNFDAQAAFLGPTLWDKRLPYDGQDFKVGWLLNLIFGLKNWMENEKYKIKLFVYYKSWSMWTWRNFSLRMVSQ